VYTPKYSITNNILKSIGSIEAAKEVIENAPLVPSYEKQFKAEALVRTIHHGTHIEGNDLNLDQTKKVLEGKEVVARQRDIQEIINYRNVVKLLDELSHKRENYNPEILIDIYKETVKGLVDEEKQDQFRKTRVVIKEEGTGKVIFQPPPFVEVPYLLKDYFNWLNSEETQNIHPVLLAGITHYVLVTIHPFIEGNGRTVRAFATLILLRGKYDIKRFFALEEHFDNDPAAYYESLSKVDKQDKDIGSRDLTPWLEYFCQVVAIELEKIKG